MTKLGQNSKATDIEDLLEPEMYLEYFNKTFAKQLGGVTLIEADLPPGDRIVHRLEKHLSDKGIKIRPSGGYNHYAVAATFGATPPTALPNDVKKRFAAMFEALNKLF
ncbi:hypothetical protein [Polaromonas sp. LjRoot131]|uniref:hypothetical protein n=1 Tax=Polaromonas sp. LjRoot131 TaxID=3342262 RepID=UPI003ECFB1D6